MNVKIFAAVAVLALALGIVATTSVVLPVKATNNDKCVSEQSKDRTSTSTTCLTGDKDFENGVKDAKKECKETTDNKDTRCSSSQTGNGEFGNFAKP